MLTRIRNASQVRKREVRLPYSRMKYAIAKILADEGFVESTEKAGEPHPEILISLKYEDGDCPKIKHVSRISTPGNRVYLGYSSLPRVLSDYGIAIISTSQGLMTNKEARKRKLGGEVLCKVY